MNQNDVTLLQQSDCLLHDAACEEHYMFWGPGLDNGDLPKNWLHLCWYDSWYDNEENRMEGPSWKITLTRSTYWSREERAISPEDWRSISETRWTMFVGARDQAIEEAMRRYLIVTSIDLNVSEIDELNET